MNVAFFLFFPSTLWTPGGGETQIAKSKEALEMRGVQVELFDIWSRRKDYDLFHVFGSTYEVSSFVTTLRKLGLPVVVSAIAYSIKPSWQWDLVKRLDHLIPIPTTYRLRREIYRQANVVIAASPSEAKHLEEAFGVEPEKIRIVPHGVEAERFANTSPEPFINKYGLKDFVLQVSRISRSKGQARLIRALRGTGLKLVFIGPFDPEDPLGKEEFLRLVEENKDWVYYLGPISHEDPFLASAYRAARVHVLPSASESFGLVTLEALASGIAAISGRYPPLYDVVGDRVYYCDPFSEQSIRRAVLEAYERGPKPGAKEFVIRELSWDRVGERLEDVYREVLR
ncbi:glycosyltransferase family 4 protein [Hydrogenibacillus schlegelii]|uniref:glycosyltransferase family 4 protein n=1 Tax=Hydrogenibacillus schlegelii TaxID=1484 RepID=UPI002354032A|nr:glycosyltransferase family 4 protein [Hydrogenibacillus schlegelii]